MGSTGVETVGLGGLEAYRYAGDGFTARVGFLGLEFYLAAGVN
jgi:hypothetical protein